MTATEPEDSQFEGMLTDLYQIWRKTPVDWAEVQRVAERAGFAYPFEEEVIFRFTEDPWAESNTDHPVGNDSSEGGPSCD